MARGRVVVSVDRCKGCSLCVEACPQNVLAMDTKVNVKGYTPAVAINPDKCTGCTFCALVCPDVCIEVYREKGGTKNG
ncbi:4Fe-4S binding protein [Mycoplasmatota bacterium]|nr:4Fe-4S binding protein [Mycoplasmatota bacterium]